MNFFFILFCLNLCVGVNINLADSDISMLRNISKNIKISNNDNFPTLISALTKLSFDSEQVMSVVTVLSHMIYETSNILAEIGGDIHNAEISLDEAQIIMDEAQIVMDVATEQKNVIIIERNSINTVIEMIGGNNLDCLNGTPYHDGCLQDNTQYGIDIDRIPRSIEECLQALRVNEEDSALVRGLLWNANGHCRTFNMDTFDACGTSWDQDSFTNSNWRTCRVIVEEPEQFMPIVTVMSHMLYDVSITLVEVDGDIYNAQISLDEAQITINETQRVMDIATERNNVAIIERDAINIVIEILGGNNLDCLNGTPYHDGCLQDNTQYGIDIDRIPRSIEECLQALRVNEEDSALVRGLLWNANGNCRTFNMDTFDACGTSWDQDSFTNSNWRTCRVIVNEL